MARKLPRFRGAAATPSGPRRALRCASRASALALPLDTILVTNADLDPVLGLLVLRKSLPDWILSARAARGALLHHNAVFRPLEPAWGALGVEGPVFLDRDERIEARLFPVLGMLPTYFGDKVASAPGAAESA